MAALPTRWKTVAVLIAVAAFCTLPLSRHLRQTHSVLQATAALPMAPDFLLADLEGKPLALSAYRGKVVLLDYWATWCAPCKIEIPHLIELQKRYGGQGLQVIGVSMDDDAEPVRPFAKTLAINYPVAMGNLKVAEAYGGILGLPKLFLIDRDGRIVRKIVGEVSMSELQTAVEKLLQQR